MTVLGCGTVLAADVFHMPEGSTSLEFVTVGNPKNEPDPATGNKHGKVEVAYRMGKYHVTAKQYCVFLNAVAATDDPHGLYNPAMNSHPRGCKIVQAKTEKGYSYSVDAATANHPVNFVSWGDAARFCNWLHNGQKNDPATTEDGAYELNGKTDRAGLMAVKRKDGAKYFLPNDNEWYKAAYFTPDKNGKPGYWKYPMQSDDIPSNRLSATEKNSGNFEKNGHSVAPNGAMTAVGYFAASPSASGTFDQGGNAWQWIEDPLSDWTRSMRGGSFMNNYNYFESKYQNGYHSPTYEEYHLGFRVAGAAETEK